MPYGFPLMDQKPQVVYTCGWIHIVRAASATLGGNTSESNEKLYIYHESTTPQLRLHLSVYADSSCLSSYSIKRNSR